MAEGTPAFPKFDIGAPNLAVHWSKWIARLENLMTAMDIKDPVRKSHGALSRRGRSVRDL